MGDACSDLRYLAPALSEEGGPYSSLAAAQELWQLPWLLWLSEAAHGRG